jgi:hypothetical protein
MPLNDPPPPVDSSGASSPAGPAPERKRVRRTCPKVTPRKPPKWVSKKETVGGRCNYIGADGNLCPHWRAKDSLACPCHVEAYEGPDSTAGMRFIRTKKSKRTAVLIAEPDPRSWFDDKPR